MTEIARSGTPSVASELSLASNRISGSAAGEDIAAGDACYIASDGKAHPSCAAAAGPAADVRGFAEAAALRGEGVTLVFDVTMRYGEGLPHGASLYLSGTVPGGLADAPAPDCPMQIAFVVDTTRIRVLQS